MDSVYVLVEETRDVKTGSIMRCHIHEAFTSKEDAIEGILNFYLYDKFMKDAGIDAMISDLKEIQSDQFLRAFTFKRTLKRDVQWSYTYYVKELKVKNQNAA